MNGVKSHTAFGRTKGTEDWRPITMYGQMFYADVSTLTDFVNQMRHRNPNIDYKIEEVE